MRIIINEPDQKTKFYKMAALFAEEYNKYVAPEDRARIVLPYSFLLSKVRHLFPETLKTVKNGDYDKKFVMLAHEKPELFQFVFTREDQALYRDLYAGAQAFIARYKEIDRANAPAPRPPVESEAALPSETISRATLASLYARAQEINEMLRVNGHSLEHWFRQNGIGDDSQAVKLSPLKPDAEKLSGPGLFLAMLQTGEVRNKLGLANTPLPVIGQDSLPFYRKCFEDTNELLAQVNTDTAARAERQHAAKKLESMSAHKRERLPVSKGKMAMVMQDALKYAGALGEVSPQWLAAHGIANTENALEYEGHSGAALLQALVANSDVRQMLAKDAEITRVSKEAMYTLAKMGGETIFAVDDPKFYDEYVRPLLGEKPRVMQPREENVPFVERLRKKPRRDTFKANEKGEFPELSVPKPHLLYEVLKQRLTALKEGHPEREDSINATLAAMHEEIQRSGHGNAISATRIPAAEKPETKKDPQTHAHIANAVETILADNPQMDNRVQSALQRALRVANTQSRGHANGNGNGNGHRIG